MAGAAAQAPVPAPPIFAQCLTCHTIDQGKNGFGPSLAGVGGRPAASLPDFPYSAALKGSGLTWNAETLERWLTSPQALVPGTRMPFSGIRDPAMRAAVVEYLLTLR